MVSRATVAAIVCALAGSGALLAAVPTLQDGPGPASAPGPLAGSVERHGYLATRDGTLLAFDLVLPGDGSGRYPTLLEYSGYNPGEVVDRGYVERFVPRGYALLGVNVRGTGCSGGRFDFMEPQQALDGYDAVEWIANQSWSDGKVAMIGKSMPGITQLFVAAQRPPHLVAAAPGHVYGDLYRDVAYPGGIFNYAFAGLWSLVAQPAPGAQASARGAGGGDQVCAEHSAARQADNARYHPLQQALAHPFDDALHRERSPVYGMGNVTIPLFLFQSWQDEQVGPRGLVVVEELRSPWWLTVSNGDHAMYRTNASLDRLERFFDRFVKGEENGFENEPRVLAWFDADAQTRSPGWTRELPGWPVADATPLTLHLRAGGLLSETAPTGPEPSDAYVHPAGTTSNGAGYGYPWPAAQTTDRLRPPAPARATFVSAPLARDAVVVGSGNLTIWVSSTATDADVQATLSEVRPDGKVVHVQKGWLRASHRALDPARSTPYRPVHPHDAAASLQPGELVEMSLEIQPLGHAFRAGSSLRLDLEAPSVLPELWGFASTAPPGVVTIAHDPEHASRLVLPLVDGGAGAPLPACGALIRQGCA